MALCPLRRKSPVGKWGGRNSIQDQNDETLQKTCLFQRLHAFIKRTLSPNIFMKVRLQGSVCIKWRHLTKQKQYYSRECRTQSFTMTLVKDSLKWSISRIKKGSLTEWTLCCAHAVTIFESEVLRLGWRCAGFQYSPSCICRAAQISEEWAHCTTAFTFRVV